MEKTNNNRDVVIFFFFFRWMEFHSINEITDVNFRASDDCALCTFNDMMDSRMMRSNLLPQLLIWFPYGRLSAASCACASVVVIHPRFWKKKNVKKRKKQKTLLTGKNAYTKNHQVVPCGGGGCRDEREAPDCQPPSQKKRSMMFPNLFLFCFLFVCHFSYCSSSFPSAFAYIETLICYPESYIRNGRY